MIASRPEVSAGQAVGADGIARCTFAGLAKVVPSLFSAFVWLMCAGMLGGWFPVLAAVLVVLVVGGRRWAPLFAWRYGVRAATDQEAAAVCAALEVRVPTLRGRGQPRVWVDAGGERSGVQALTHHDLAVPAPMVLALLHGTADPEAFCAATCWTFGTRKVRNDGIGHSLAELFWLPASALGAAFDGPARAFLRLPLIHTAWMIRFIYGPIALFQEWNTPRFGYAIGACVVLALTYLAPWWQRRYLDELERAGDAEVVRCGMALVWAQQLRRQDASLATEQRAARLEAASGAGGGCARS